MFSFRSWLAAPLVLLIATTAHAETRKRERTVASGKMEQLFVHSDYGSNCKGGPAPKIALRKKPAHGTISAGKAVENVNKPGHKCDGRKFNGVGVFYKSEPGFTGTDRVVYRRGQGDNAFDVDVTIHVR